MLRVLVIVWVALVIGYGEVTAQVAGRYTFSFLNLPNNARIAGLGGLNTALAKGHPDVNLFSQNPALLDSTQHQQLGVNFNPYFAGISNTSVHYAHQSAKAGIWGFGLHFVNYGTLQQTDDAGNVLGSFQANDFALTTAYAHQVNHFRFGFSLKLIGSQLAGYNAYALGFDLGVIFKHPEKDFVAAVVFKNVGFPISGFVDYQSIVLPFDARLGIAYKPAFMPFRFHLTIYQLYEYDVNSRTGNAQATGATTQNQPGSLADNLFRHLAFGGELLISRNFQLRVGYNHQIRQDLRWANGGLGMAGFSMGLMIRVKAFEFSYTLAGYHPVALQNFFTLNTHFTSLKKR